MPKKTKTTKKDQGTAALPAAGKAPVKPNAEVSEEKFEQARAEIQKIIANESADLAGNAPLEIPHGPKKITVEDTSDTEPEDVLPDTDSSVPIKEFSAFYQNSGDEKVDMTTIVRKDPHRKKKIIGVIIGILVVLLAATLSGFYFFVHRGDKFNEEDILINPQLTATVASGAEFTMTLEVQNNGSLNINDVELTVQAPNGFMFAGSDPSASDEAHTTWQLGTIKSHARKQVEVTGAITGDSGSLENFEVVVSYKPSNFNSTFTKSKSFGVTINESVLGLTLSMPTKAVSGRPAEYKVTYTNNSKETMRHVRVTLIMPDGVTASDFNPAATRDTSVWDIDRLNAGENGMIMFKGTITGDEGMAKEIKIEIGYVDDQGTYHKQTENSAIVFIVNPQLVLTLSVNDSSADGAVHFGDTLHYTVKYRNDSQSEIKDMNVVVEITGDAIDWTTITMPQAGTVTNNVISWNAQQIAALKAVKSGSSGEIQFSVNTKESIQAQKATDKNYSIVSKATASSQDVTDLEGTSLEVASNTITDTLISKLSLRAEGRYYDDQFVQVGTGPIPPQVGVATTYQVYWYLQNNANEVKDVTVKATIPANAVWTNDSSISAGGISYDATTRVVTWSINKIPPQVGQSIPELSAHFAIQITPQSADVGNALGIIGTSEATAFDSFAGVQVVASQPAITTDLPDDPQAAGKGLVVSTSANTNSQ